MSRYIKSISRTYEFEGDHVAVQFRPLLFPDLLRVEATTANSREFMVLAAELVPQYVTSMTGLRDAAGVELTLQEVAGTGYFLSLLAQMMQDLITCSIPSNPPSPAA